MKLYICGNGFDLHHSLKTSYDGYKKFLEQNYPGIVQRYEEYSRLSKCRDLWRDIEDSLDIDFEDLLEESITTFYPHYSNDSDSRWFDIDTSIDCITDFIYIFTGECFFEWIRKLDYNNVKVDSNLGLTKDDIYITFNYADLLQRLYNIRDDHILHIHGAAKEVDTSLFINIDDTQVLSPSHKKSKVIRDVIQFGAGGVCLLNSYSKFTKPS